MNDAKILEIQSAAKVFILDEAKAQVAAGKPNSGMTKTRQAAFIAKTLAEMIDSFADEENADETKRVSKAQVIQATMLGTSLMNQSALRQDLEKAGVFKVATLNTDEYGV